MSNTTTLAHGWKLTRADGVVLAFTDHDRDLTIASITYLASAALTPSEAAASLGLAVNDQEVQGALASAAITESDIAAGAYDGAEVEAVEIDWSVPEVTAVVGVYTVGEIARTETAFTAELRSRAGLLAQRRGRYCTASCDAEVGDSRCGVDLTSSTFTGSGTVLDVHSDVDIEITGVSSYADGWFSGGLLTWTSGGNDGKTHAVRVSSKESIGLWRAPRFPIQDGDTFTVTAGCDKSFATCGDKFANRVNFRGFPAVVGEKAYTYASPGDPGYDGGGVNDF